MHGWDLELFEIGERLSDPPSQIRTKVNHRRIESKRFVDTYKIRYGCMRCGFRDAAESLDFHHLNPSEKVGNVSEMVGNGLPLELIFDEIRKCIILCANCHRTVERNKNGT